MSGVLLGGRAQAQAATPVAPGSRAQVYAVATTGMASSFQVPQVRLPDAAVARRINRVLLRDVTGYFDTVDSAASPARQLRQAARECCYDEATKSWREFGNGGLTATAYTVLLNQDFLLSLAVSHDNANRTEPGGPHFTFDLRTGCLLTLADLLADPPAQLNQRFAGAINRRLRADLAGVAANYGDFATIDNVANLYGFYGVDEWNVAPSHQPAADTVSYPPVVPTYPAEFALRPQALLLFYTVGMARVQFEFLPDETYIFPYGRLHPRGLLVAVAEKAKRVKAVPPKH
ncbi:MAG: hypothetical protein WKG07_17310 [Hymenobacter sp.]